MNDQYSRRPPKRSDGGAVRNNTGRGAVQDRQRGQMPRNVPADRMNSEQMIREARMYAGVSPGYTQMPLRPMTSMPRERAVNRGPQRPPQPQRPARPEQRPPQPQRPANPGQRPHQPQRPANPGQRPPQQPQRPANPGQRPPRPQGPTRPPVQGQVPRGQVPRGQAPRGQAPRGQAPRGQAPRGQMPGGQPPRRPQNDRRRPAPPENRGGRRPAPNDQWVVPEGSAVYTAEGRMYDARRGAKDPRRGPAPDPRRKNAPARGGQQGRPAPKKKKFNKEKLFHGIKTFFVRLLTMLLIVSLLGFWWYRSEFYSHSNSRSGNVSFYMKDCGSYEVKASAAYRHDVLYVDFTEIAKWFGMVSVGSVNSMRFICTEDVSETSSGKGGEEYAIFTSGSANVLVNGTSISLEESCRTVDSHIWVPLSFVEGYVSGVICERDASGDDIVFTIEGEQESDEKDKDDKDKKDEEEEKVRIGFKIKSQNAIPSVKYPE